jgi:6-phosphogluconolactonase
MKIHEYNSADEQASALSQAIANTIEQVLRHKPQVTLAVSGGKSPIKLFEKLSRFDLAWDKVTLTLVDERFLATDHADSNENLVRKHLLINKAEQAYFIGLVTTRNILTSVSNANLHIKDIDIAILGMGEDGHTASIFPCCDELKSAVDPQLTPEKYIITNPKTAAYQRIGLSLAGILEVPNLFISINGASKLEVITKASQEKSSQYPISYVLAERKDSQVFWHN